MGYKSYPEQKSHVSYNKFTQRIKLVLSNPDSPSFQNDNLRTDGTVCVKYHMSERPAWKGMGLQRTVPRMSELLCCTYLTTSNCIWNPIQWSLSPRRCTVYHTVIRSGGKTPHQRTPVRDFKFSMCPMCCVLLWLGIDNRACHPGGHWDNHCSSISTLNDIGIYTTWIQNKYIKIHQYRVDILWNVLYIKAVCPYLPGLA